MSEPARGAGHPKSHYGDSTAREPAPRGPVNNVGNERENRPVRDRPAHTRRRSPRIDRAGSIKALPTLGDSFSALARVFTAPEIPPEVSGFIVVAAHLELERP